MNERLKQLADQAGWTIVMGTRHPIDQRDYVVSPDQAEKFAELIVRECGEVAYTAYWDNPETVRGIHIQEKIKQHFGVEE